MPTCFRCNWVLNAPMGAVKLDDLLGVTMQWLHYHGVKNVRAIKGKVLTSLRNFRKVNATINRDFNVCRHCLMESVYLLVPPSLKEPFKHTFIDVYDFDSVIY